MTSIMEEFLMHYGMPRRSGRYPYGSGENPYQHSGDFLSMVPDKYTTGKQQFAAPMLNPAILNRRIWFWLRDIVSSAVFASVYGLGDAGYTGASNSNGVRPYAVIGG